jgi:hypothetical protein
MIKPANQPSEAPTIGSSPNGPSSAPVASGESFPRPDTPEWGRMNQRRAELIRKKVCSSLTAEESKEYEYLQKMSCAVIDALHPLPPSNLADLQKLEAELREGRSDTP